jgi:diguanylate cyclase (GGDEF)-like protein/putative nucleotidyltransferase with HDIG domain
MDYVHHCVFCGWSRLAGSATLLSPNCGRCGCTLRATTRDDWARTGGAPADEHPVTPTRNHDTTAMFAALMALPILLPVLGVGVGDVTFLIPFGLLLFASVRAAGAARRVVERRGMWLSLSVGSGLAAASSALAVGTAMAGTSTQAAFYLGSTASLALVLAMTLWGRRVLDRVRMESLVDALLLGCLLGAGAIYFVAVPGFSHRAPVLTGVFLIDLVALLVAALTTVGRTGSRHRRVGWWLTSACAAATLGDAIVAVQGGGTLLAAGLPTALLWAAAGYFIAAASEVDLPRPEDRDESEPASGGRWLLVRVVLPIGAVLAFPITALVLALAGELGWWGMAFFASFFVFALGLAFGRQAWLLVDNRRAVMRERRLREEVMRRNEELEALTGLATTMTQTLEEPPIIEQALGVLHLAARATSSALHTFDGDGLDLRAVSGDWHQEHMWAAPPERIDDEGTLHERGGRQVVRLVLRARGHRIGVVTLVRGARDPFDSQQLKLLGLLVDELAVALQNARDYREKLEQAIRDPLTGIYNRRFFFEALEKEVRRCERYGSIASVAFFDVDDFKAINDKHGHAAGDDVLRRIGEIVERVIRPVDSFARIGGEEFALLMPETQQLDALLVAERVRTAISRAEILAGRRVTVSGGVATCPQDGTAREELEHRADAALYWAKRHGKDLCAVASEVVVEENGTEYEGVLAHLYALVATIDAQHLQTRDHSENVAAYAMALGQALGLDRDRIVQLRRAALLHDVGKVAVSQATLTKPSSLDDAERAEIELHSGVGATMLLHAGLTEEALWVRHHHERIDGEGYPDRLAGDDIPFEARIIFVADAFEAMTSDRPYRAGMGVDEALGELHRCAGTQFEPRIVDALERLIAEGQITVLALRSSETSDAVPTTPPAR